MLSKDKTELKHQFVINTRLEKCNYLDHFNAVPCILKKKYENAIRTFFVTVRLSVSL